MYHSWRAAAVLVSLIPRLAFAQGNSFFRPSNVTDRDTGLGDLYKWVGSYYNGTTHVEFTPNAQGKSCLNEPLPFKPVSNQFDGIFAIIAPNNSGSNPVNVAWGLWPTGFDFSSLSSQYIVWGEEVPWELMSIHTASDDTAPQYFPLNLTKTDKAPYNVSGTVGGFGIPSTLGMNVTVCNGTENVPVAITTFVDASNSSDPRNPRLNFQFNSTSVDITLSAPASINSEGDGYVDANHELPGQLKITMSGVIDSWHSDMQVDDGAKPSWKRTVNYDLANDGAKLARHYLSALGIAVVVGWLSTTLMLL